MDEYIKREDALKAVTYTGLSEPHSIVALTLLTAQKNMRKIPAADVVPRSVIAEIFAEIENLMLDGEIGGRYPAKVISPAKYAELKKKYTALRCKWEVKE